MISPKKRSAIDKLAENLRVALKEVVPPYNPDKTIKLLGGTIKYDFSFTDDQDGLIVKLGDNSFSIHLNPAKHSSRERFTLAHELGHLFLHMGYIIEPNKWNSLSQYSELVHFRDASNKRIEEYEANEFAAAFLMPRQEFQDQVRANSKGLSCNVKPIAEHFGVSIEAAEYRGKFLGIFRW